MLQVDQHILHSHTSQHPLLHEYNCDHDKG